MEELNEKKTKYFVLAIIILIILGVLLIVHFNNKQMVKGEENKGDTPTTTEKITTTTKKRVKEEVKEVYKSVIDENTKLVYNYKLTDEITETDVLISKKLEISDTFKEKNVIGLFDISLYDTNLVKKNVTNSLITIKIPITEELKGYDEYKVVYINDKNEITDEKFDIVVSSDYIEFNTTHLSVFGIIGTKKVVDLSKALLDVKVNGEVVENVTNILLEKEDKIELAVNNIEEKVEYSVYYGLKATGAEEFEYVNYDGSLDLKDGINYRLFVKIAYEDNSRTFEVGNIGLYDKVYNYDRNEELKENVVIGEIESETPYDYRDKEKNLDIVIDYTEKVEEITDADVTDDTESNETSTVENTEITSQNATIKLNGNIYLVEKTDISELEMTGHLYIDTNEDIVFAKNAEEKITLSNLYSITIRSKEFTLNGDKYSYEYTPTGDLVIYKLEETPETEVVEENAVTEETEETPEISVEEFNELFDGNYEVVVDENKKDLIIELIKEETETTPVESSNEEEQTSEPISGESKIDVETTA